MILCDDGPCLVEVGSRVHGGEGSWVPLALECVGYTAVGATLDVYLRPEKWGELPDRPLTLLKHGREVDIVNRHSGVLRGFPGEAVIRAMPSFRNINWDYKPGDFLPLTKDVFTRPGSVILVNEDEAAVDRDFEEVHRMEHMGLFDYTVMCPEPPPLGAVVVVDPFSTGAALAALASSMGYKVVLLFSERDSPVAALVSSQHSSMRHHPTVQHDSANANEEEALEATLAGLRALDVPVMAIIPGAETAVELADKLNARFGTRGNSLALTEARRHKFHMHEAVRAKGVRACMQRDCRTEGEMREFMSGVPSGTNVVVKPAKSAGSDRVYKCANAEEAVQAFGEICGVTNGLGHMSDSALVQEFLEGTEYVVDSVSRDGVHKAVAIWEYDKRDANGRCFLYYSMRLRTVEDPEIRRLVDYAHSVLDALEIFHGASHLEVKMTSTGPCLVEVGARCHGGEGTWCEIAKECVGYTQVEETLNLYLRPDRFDALPKAPQRLLKHGAEVFLVSYQSGQIRNIPGLDTVRALPSFLSLEMSMQPGGTAVPTVDCFTRPGAVQLLAASREQVEADVEVIRKMELDGTFFDLA